MRTNATQSKKPNNEAWTYSPNISKHMTEVESEKRQNKMRLTEVMTIAPAHIRTRATQTTKTNEEIQS